CRRWRRRIFYRRSALGTHFGIVRHGNAAFKTEHAQGLALGKCEFAVKRTSFRCKRQSHETPERICVVISCGKEGLAKFLKSCFSSKISTHAMNPRAGRRGSRTKIDALHRRTIETCGRPQEKLTEVHRTTTDIPTNEVRIALLKFTRAHD